MFGTAFEQALAEPPRLVLSFYSYGVLMRKCEGDQRQEYAIDPAQLVKAIAPEMVFDTGLLHPDILLIRQKGVSRLVVGYRPPQMTGIWLEGSEAPLRVPLPGLVMFRITKEERNPSYSVYAVKKRPASMDEPLYRAPLPNIYTGGSVCWGTVPTTLDDTLQGDWQKLLGSPFGSHSVYGKSKKFQNDVRQRLMKLHTRYPLSDLIEERKSFGKVVNDYL